MSRWPAIIVGFFAVVIAMNCVLVYLAVSTAPELEPSYTHGNER